MRISRSAFALLGSAVLALPIAAQTWTPRTPVTSPLGRIGHAMAYDAARQRVVMFGGQNQNTYLGDTWEWDGNDWVQRFPTNRPPERVSSAMAYDPVRQRVVLFGGFSPASYFGDTWEWDGSDWTLRFPSSSPLPRARHQMEWDGSRDRIVLYGGDTNQGQFLETWEWDGDNWTNVSPPVRLPSNRVVLAFDSVRGKLVAVPDSITETWERAGTTWTRIFGAGASAPARANAAMAFSALGQDAVLFGGSGTNDTWEWDGATWRQVLASPAPAPRSQHAMAYDAARQVIVMFGGSASSNPVNDTWEYRSAASAVFTTFGTGCHGGGSPPVLTATLPRLGTTQVIAMTNLPPGQPMAMLWFGVSNQQWGPNSLPMSLAPYGLPSCSLDISPNLAAPAPVSGGVAAWGLVIPTSPGLLGLHLYTQGWVADPSSSFGVGMSNAGDSVLGM
jgi:hypothetical protein